MPDMLVKLYDLKDDPQLFEELASKGIKIKRALSPNRSKVLDFIRENFSQGWADECEAAFSNSPVSCYIAEKDGQVIGFACYDATEKDFFGPTGVKESERGHRIGSALLLKCLFALYAEGYAYAIIGSVSGARPFYEKIVNATVIEGSDIGIYSRMIGSP